MVTLEVHGQLVNWPEDFALVMMRYYHNHGVPFKVHRHLDQPPTRFAGLGHKVVNPPVRDYSAD